MEKNMEVVLHPQKEEWVPSVESVPTEGPPATSTRTPADPWVVQEAATQDCLPWATARAAPWRIIRIQDSAPTEAAAHLAASARIRRASRILKVHQPFHHTSMEA